MLPVTVQFIVAMLAVALNERMARKAEHLGEENRLSKRPSRLRRARPLWRSRTSSGDVWQPTELAKPGRSKVRGASETGPHPYVLNAWLDWDSGSDNEQAAVRLNNLGYARASTAPSEAVKAFQFDYRVDHVPVPDGLVGGKLPAKTRDRLWASCEANQCNAET